ncbi:hypothetical protein [Actinospica robiniae]|uniref:hypothetical protein n=1 Tax=Actinospica robiniae TaxID=304901 RepID=UPI0003F84AB4|nr:hypothetical protein [Actinospica robiniae]
MATVMASLGTVAGCASANPPGSGGTGSLPTREQAFQLSEIYINQILLAINQKPTTQFIYAEGSCDETDAMHGAISLDYVAPGSISAKDALAELRTVGAAVAHLGYGTPVYQDQEDGAYVNVGPFSILFDTDGGTLGFSVKTCYASPAPSMSPGLAGVMQPLIASPAPTSTAGSPVGIPTPAGSGSPSADG